MTATVSHSGVHLTFAGKFTLKNKATLPCGSIKKYNSPVQATKLHSTVTFTNSSELLGEVQFFLATAGDTS
jgi:hypothetical protein